MNKQAAEALSIARSRLLLDHPFFGVLSLKLQLQGEPSIPTLATDGKHIFYNPEFVLNGLTDALRMSAVAHEVMHCVLEHILRRGGRDPDKWNRACDYALNGILKDAGFSLGEDWLYNSAFNGMAADEIYNLLPDVEDEHGKALCNVMDAASTKAQAEEAQLEWKLATVQAAKADQDFGKMPGQLRKMLQDVLSPPIPWRDVLASWFTERVKDDYSFRRPNPYYIHSGVYLPIMDGIGMGEVAIALDTSGSTASVLDEFGSTVKDIFQTVRPSRVHMIYCDARVNHVEVFERGQELKFEAVGGGGTSFVPVFDYLQEHHIDPACLLYLTDMYGTFPKEVPPYPTLWCATSDKIAPFGETLRIKK